MASLNTFVFKLVLVPLIVAGATQAARRWGQNIGGLLVGLPLTSGPLSVFFALEQGRSFAASAAVGSILGLIPVAAFCTGYVRSARRFPWFLAAVIGIACYLAAIACLSLISPGLGLTAFLVPSVLGLALIAFGKLEAVQTPLASPWWDLPLRMVIATGLLITITTAAGALGPKWSGMLSPFPIFTFVMATFSHYQGGVAAASRLIRGVLVGLFAYTAFFLIVALLIGQTSLVFVYTLATVTALGVESVSLVISLRSRN